MPEYGVTVKKIVFNTEILKPGVVVVLREDKENCVGLNCLVVHCSEYRLSMVAVDSNFPDNNWKTVSVVIGDVRNDKYKIDLLRLVG